MQLAHRAASTSRFARTTLLPIVLILVAACAEGASTASPGPVSSPASSGSPGAAATPEPSPSVTATPSAVAPGGAIPATVPIACYGLGQQDCRRVSEHVATLLESTDPQIRYVQVGPFGCPDGQRCPTTLAARPEGDVTFEGQNGGVGFHVTLAGDLLQADRQEVFAVSLPPTTRPPLPAAGQPFELGHCGLWSGIDLGGSWWDPVGFVDSDHPDSINASPGTIVLTAPDRATFTSRGGLTVHLVRRDGEKLLPLCQ